MANEKIAILGSDGMLGSDIVSLCQGNGLKTAVFDLPDFDITVPEQLADALDGADAVINCAAYTNVDKCESETELAHKVNAEAVGNLGKIAQKNGVWVLHFSTDFVFDGKADRPYSERGIPNPINEYGKSKLAGEQLLTESGCRSCIIRVQWTYGKNGNNFITKVIQKAKSGDKLTIVNDQVGCPTATTKVAEAALKLLNTKPTGLFHYASAGFVSRFELAKFICGHLNLPARITPCKSSHYDSPAKRPLNSRFNCDKIRRLLNKPISPWQDGLREFLDGL